MCNGVAWCGVLGPQWPSKCVRFAQPPLRGTSPQLCTPWLRTPGARCARSGPSGALMRQPSQLQGPTCRGGLTAALRVCPLRVRPPPVPSVAPRCASVLPVCARPAPAVHVVGYRWPHASACTMAGPDVAWLARSGLQGVPAARQPPPLCPRGTSPQLCTPWLRTPSACCARSGQTVALMCGLVQWCDLMQCCWPQKTRALFTAVRRTPPSFSRTINTTVHTHLLSF